MDSTATRILYKFAADRARRHVFCSPHNATHRVLALLGAMRWDRNYTSSEIEDHRSEGGAGLDLGGGGFGGGGVFLLIRALSIFGWKGILVGLVIAGVVAMGGQCSNAVSHVSSHQTDNWHSTPEEDQLVHFVGFVFDDVQRTWRAQIPGYTDAHLVLFRRAYRSACGTASTAVGPFYCPNDQKVYLDLSFFSELANKLGAPGQFAEAYVIAHEVGHHVQKLTGVLKSSSSVPIELQADCLAGAWAKDADRRGIVERGDVDQALNAASQIGDDTLQRKAQGYVQPETFTHGTSAQRKASFEKGYDGGREACGIR
jgi:predicted metalloprotease